MFLFIIYFLERDIVYNMEEWDIYDKNFNKTGRTCIRGEYKLKENEYHLVVHIWLFTEKGEILLTQRAPNKPISPLKWECNGGSVLKGESAIEGAIRELNEEIGIKLNEKDLRVLKTKRRDEYFNDFLFVYYSIVPKDIINKIIFKDGEVIDKKWVTLEEFNKMVNNDEMVKNICYIQKDYYQIFTE